MREKALVLTGHRSLPDDRRAARLLNFFGIPSREESATHFCLSHSGALAPNECYRLIIGAEAFNEVIEQIDKREDSPCFGKQIHSVFLHSNGDPVALAKTLQHLSAARVSIRRGAKGQVEWNITDDPDGMCGAMRGLHVHPSPATLNGYDFFEAREFPGKCLIGAEDKAAFLKLNWRGIPFFICSVPLLDIHAELNTGNFDIRDHFFAAMPFVSYVKWAFPETAWNPAEHNACLVIDDPLLISRYGFICYEELLALMRQCRFSTSIAFIPWNWRRSESRVVELFKKNPQNYSICIHGCDHTANEFNTSDRRRLRALASEALGRMTLHEDRTGLSHDRVMIFPQGKFSVEAILELKSAGFDAVVNTELNSNPPQKQKLTISDVWDVAVMRYADFPVYTRRYPTQGLENFAFDLLLGKPCVIAIHHEFCSDGCARLRHFVDRLNALRVPLVWRCLGDVLRRSYRQKKRAGDSTEIEMYCNQALIENRSKQSKPYVVRRREREPESIENVRAGTEELAWRINGDCIEFDLTLQPDESAVIALRFKGGVPTAYGSQSIITSATTRLRRYLSEARDNYLAPAKARIGGSSYV